MRVRCLEIETLSLLRQNISVERGVFQTAAAFFGVIFESNDLSGSELVENRERSGECFKNMVRIRCTATSKGLGCEEL